LVSSAAWINQSAADFINASRDGLAALGYKEPSTLKIQERFADYKPDRIPALVQELEQLRVAIIVTHAAATLPVVTGQHRVPVVYELSADPPSAGLAADLAHPLHNATGITLMSIEMNGKRLELLHEIARKSLESRLSPTRYTRACSLSVLILNRRERNSVSTFCFSQRQIVPIWTGP
jgi:ABC transporter substrate binding protein